MLKSKYRWILHNKTNESHINLPLSNSIKRMLIKRGIKSTEEAEQFLYPKLEHLHDPFLFPDMDKAIKRIREAINNSEKILIYGDYDADGVTSTAVLMKALKKLGANVDYYIPNRFTEGYGPNEKAFMEAYELGFQLIITVDNGIAAPMEAQLLKRLGIDLIITDHHEEQDELPEAYAIIHPKLAQTYPFDHLAGVGVAFKLAQALLGELDKELLGLAAIGTIADLVPLAGENRMIVKHGMEALNRTNMPGINALKQIANVDEVTENTIGFAFGPRLNAVGRLQDASLAVDLLLEEDDSIAVEIAKEVETLNQERQRLVTQITEEALIEIEKHFSNDEVLVLAKENWNPGVLGIVASKIINKYHRPTILLSINPETNEAKGSGRSIPAFDLFEHGMALRDYFLQFGGHAQAAGMTVGVEKIGELRQALIERARGILTEEDFIPHIDIEDDLEVEDLTLQLPEQIQLLAPFGMGNPKPIFKINNVTIQEIRKIGAKQNHLKMLAEKANSKFDIIGFQLGELAKQLAVKSTADLVGELEINEWNGMKKLQVVLKDIASDELQLFDFRGIKQLQQLNDQIVLHNTVLFSFQNKSIDINLQLPIIYYNQEELSRNLINVNHIVFIDLPKRLDDMIHVLSIKKFHSIYACFQTESSEFFERMPTREDFKTLYTTLLKHKNILEHQKMQLAKAKRWTMAQLDFMLNVFLDLKFVTIMNGEIVLQENAEQQSLTNSITYQQKLNKIEVEKTLYFSKFEQLKDWMLTQMASVEKKGEVVHGL
ncbi:single-stranded-DNA-specific exonuclease RecJ [Bacillaceae bacterium W0354]